MCRKCRDTYVAITNIRDDNASLLFFVKLYKYVVIPSVLYGCEVWNYLKNKNILLLNRLQRTHKNSPQYLDYINCCMDSKDEVYG